MTARNEYKQGELAEVVQWDTRNIAYYTNVGVLVPQHKVSTGKGDHNIFGDRNVQEARILKALSRYGVPLETVKKIMEVIRKKSPEVLESRELRTFLLLRHKNKRIDIEPVLLDEPVDPQRPLLFVGDMVGADSAIVVNLLE